MYIDDFAGYCQYREEEYIFNFKEYIIELIPSSYSKLMLNSILEPITKKNEKGFISDFILNGTLFDGRKVFFCVQDILECKNGIYRYKAKWVYIFCNRIDQLQVKGINYVSNEINFIYNTKKYIDDDYQLSDGNFKNYTFNIKNLNRKKLGEFVNEKRIINIYGDMTWKRNYNSANTLEMWSKLSLELNGNLDEISFLYKISILQKCVIDFLTYRTNNSFTSIETYYYNDKHQRYPSGNLYIDFTNDIENDVKIISHLVNVDNIDNIGILYKLIDDGKIQQFHFPKKSSDKLIYDTPRMLGIMISFEKLFNWKLNKNEIRSDKHLEMLDRIKNVLESNKDSIMEGLSGQKRKFDRMVALVSKAEVNYASMVRHVVKKYPICVSCIKNIYGKENLDNELTKLSERLNTLRNGIAHGKIKIDFTLDNTKDLKFLELVVYIVILYDLGLDDEIIIKKIAWLFNINPFIY